MRVPYCLVPISVTAKDNQQLQVLYGNKDMHKCAQEQYVYEKLIFLLTKPVISRQLYLAETHWFFSSVCK